MSVLAKAPAIPPPIDPDLAAWNDAVRGLGSVARQLGAARRRVSALVREEQTARRILRRAWTAMRRTGRGPMLTEEEAPGVPVAVVPGIKP